MNFYRVHVFIVRCFPFLKRFYNFVVSRKYILRTLVAYLGNIFTDGLVYFVLISFFGIYEFLAHIVSFCCGALYLFLLHKYWTFGNVSGHKSMKREVWRFAKIIGTALIASFLVLNISGFFVNAYLAKIFALCITVAIYAAGFPHYVFKTGEKPSNTEAG